MKPEAMATLSAVASTATLVVVQIFGVFYFKRRSHWWIIQRRYPSIVVAEAIALLIILLVALPLLLHQNILDLANEWVRHEDHHIVEDSNDTLDDWMPAVSAVATPIFYFVSFAEAARLWLIYFNLKCLSAAQNAKWGALITSTFEAKDRYLRNRGTLGNEKWLIPRVLALWLLVSVLTVIWNLSKEIEGADPLWAKAIDSAKGLCLIGPYLFIAVIYCKSPKTDPDHLMLHYEFKGVSILLLVVLIEFTVAMILSIFGRTLAARTLTLYAVLFSLSMPSLLSTVWIPFKIVRSKQWEHTVRIESVIISHGLFKNREVDRRGKRARSNRGELMILFRCRHKLNALVFWMRKEFCDEAIICFIEMAQFKEHLIDLLLKKDPHFFNGQTVRNRFSFHEHIPKSSVVFNDDLGEIAEDAVSLEMIAERGEQEEGQTVAAEPGHRSPENECPATGFVGKPSNSPMLEIDSIFVSSRQPEAAQLLSAADLRRVRKKMHDLFEKYIETDSRLEINIAGSLKQRFQRLDAENYQSLSERDMVRVFDTVIMEMFSMIEQSYCRMIRSLATETA